MYSRLLAGMIAVMSIGGMSGISSNAKARTENFSGDKSTRIIVEVNESLENLSKSEIMSTQDNAIRAIRSNVTRNFDLVTRYSVLNNAFVLDVNKDAVEAIKALYTGPDGSPLDISSALYSNFETLLTNLINSGNITIIEKPAGADDFPEIGTLEFADYETSVATNTKLQETQDDVEIRKAEAKYEADMKRIDMKDRKYDYDLAALDNERNAIKNEMENLKTVAKDNVDRTFKLFG